MMAWIRFPVLSTIMDVPHHIAIMAQTSEVIQIGILNLFGTYLAECNQYCVQK